MQVRPCGLLAAREEVWHRAARAALALGLAARPGRPLPRQVSPCSALHATPHSMDRQHAGHVATLRKPSHKRAAQLWAQS